MRGTFNEGATVLAVAFFLMLGSLNAQNSFPAYDRYLLLCKTADSLYYAKDYMQAAKTYSLAARSQVEKAIQIVRSESWYQTACCYALASQTDSAFFHLQSLVQQSRFSDSLRLVQDQDLLSLHSDARWHSLLQQSADNAICKVAEEKRIALRIRPERDYARPVFYPLTSFAAQFIEQDSLPFLSLNHGNFRLYFSASSYAFENINKATAMLDDALQRALEITGESSYQRGIHALLFNSADELKALTGIRAQGGIAFPDDDLACFPFHQNRRPQIRHEIFHVISIRQWGRCNSRLLIEGSAVYADHQCLVERPIESVNAWLMKEKKLFSLRELIFNFDQLARENDVIAYLQSAGIFMHLFQKYGREKMKQLWTRGFSDFDNIYGFSIDELEQEWLKTIANIPVPQIDGKKLLEEGCG
jgi:hypothetical protein